jgi:hypothetical protein
MDESTLQRSLQARPPFDPIYRPRLDAAATLHRDRRPAEAPWTRVRYRYAVLVLAAVAGVGLSLGAISLLGGSRGVAPSSSPSASPVATSFQPGSVGAHIVPALAELRTLSDALSRATRQASAVDQELLREPSKALLQWAIDEQGWSADSEETAASGCPELVEWKRAARDLEVSAAEEWRHIASGSGGDLGAVYTSIDALLSIGEGIDPSACQSGSR